MPDCISRSATKSARKASTPMKAMTVKKVGFTDPHSLVSQGGKCAGRPNVPLWAPDFLIRRSGFFLLGRFLARLLDRLFGGLLARLPGGEVGRGVSHRSGVAVGGVVGGNLTTLGGKARLLHGILGDLLVAILRLPVLGLGGEAGKAIAPAFRGGHQALVLLFGKLPNNDVQIGFRHFLCP